jgi:hypothetical protein
VRRREYQQISRRAKYIRRRKREKARAVVVVLRGMKTQRRPREIFSQTGGNRATLEFYFFSTVVAAAREVFREKKRVPF